MWTAERSLVKTYVFNIFKITTFSHLEHRRNLTEYSFYNCSRYQNAKTRQTSWSKLSVEDAKCVANAKIKYSYLVLTMQK